MTERSREELLAEIERLAQFEQWYHDERLRRELTTKEFEGMRAEIERLSRIINSEYDPEKRIEFRDIKKASRDCSRELWLNGYVDLPMLIEDLNAEIARLQAKADDWQAGLQRIDDHIVARSELYTNDADLLETISAIARALLKERKAGPGESL